MTTKTTSSDSPSGQMKASDEITLWPAKDQIGFLSMLPKHDKVRFQSAADVSARITAHVGSALQYDEFDHHKQIQMEMMKEEQERVQTRALSNSNRLLQTQASLMRRVNNACKDDDLWQENQSRPSTTSDAAPTPPRKVSDLSDTGLSVYLTRLQGSQPDKSGAVTRVWRPAGTSALHQSDSTPNLTAAWASKTRALMNGMLICKKLSKVSSKRHTSSPLDGAAASPHPHSILKQAHLPPDPAAAASISALTTNSPPAAAKPRFFSLTPDPYSRPASLAAREARSHSSLASRESDQAAEGVERSPSRALKQSVTWRDELQRRRAATGSTSIRVREDDKTDPESDPAAPPPAPTTPVTRSGTSSLPPLRLPSIKRVA